MEPKQTSKGMPVISQETIDAVVGRYSGRTGKEGTDWGLHLTEIQKRIIREDPNLVKYIEIIVGKYPQHLHNDMLEVAVSLYAILEWQADCNRLKI